jgi:eukaryotic-like serine/threonine-protein kinase
VSRRIVFRGRGLLLALVGALAGILAFNLLIMPRFVRHGEEAVVPNLHGVAGTEIEARLRASGLRLGATTRAFDDEVPMGEAARQTPPAGARVKRGREIDIVVSLGTAALRVPEVEHQSLVHARFLLGQNGLKDGRRRSVRTAETAPEEVVAADPRPGTPVRGRAAVDLLVSAGPIPQRYLMPDLRGTTVEEATGMLEAAGMLVELRGATRRGDRVRETTPAPGSPIEAGATIALRAGR